jgi:glycerol uptake facilitator protein
MNNALARRLGAEVLGTMILVFFGSAIAMTVPQLPGGLAFGFALVIAVLVVGSISGAHVNPSVTVALALRGRFPWRDVPAYVGAQLVGGVLAALVMFLSFGHSGSKAGLAATHLTPPYDSGKYLVAALLLEAVGTFLLCYTVISLTDPRRTGNTPLAFGIGFALAVGAMAAGAATGGSLNFARTFGPELMLSMTGGSAQWGHIWVYLIGPMVGAAIAAYAHGWLAADEPAPATPAPAAPKQPARARGK